MIISFIGHSSVLSQNRIRNMVKEQIKRLISSNESVVCYLGGHGDFDEVCAGACRELKRENYRVELVYVTPYLNTSAQRKIKELIFAGEYDSSLYPPIEKAPLKFAISKRNEWMMKNSDVIIAYVDHSWGGAFRSLKFAIAAKKKIINICNYV